MKPFGDRLHERITNNQNQLFIQGELSQLTFQAYTQYAEWIRESGSSRIDVTFPLGF